MAAGGLKDYDAVISITIYIPINQIKKMQIVQQELQKQQQL